jgi:hypothetical protein
VRDRIRLLSLAVTATVLLLAGSALLVVLGLFNGYLHWDLFSPEVEKVLYAVFGSCVALGVFGAAISVVLGIEEVVLSFRRLTERVGSAGSRETATAPGTPRASWRFYLVALAVLGVLLGLIVLGFNYANQRVLAHRTQVFKLVVRDQMTELGPRFTKEVSGLGAPCATCGAPALAELLRNLQGLSFCRSAVLYLPDPRDAAVLWRLSTSEYCQGCGVPEVPQRVLISGDLDRAVRLALSGDTAWVEQMDRDPAFHWYQLLRGADGKVRAVLEIWGNDSESFREYRAGALAEAKRQGPR